MTNRADYIVHLVLAFLLAAMFACYAFLAVVAPLAFGEWYTPAVGSVGMVACVWMYCRMVIHCAAAVSREVSAMARKARHQAELQRELDRKFDDMLSAPPVIAPPRSITHKRRAA